MTPNAGAHVRPADAPATSEPAGSPGGHLAATPVPVAGGPRRRRRGWLTRRALLVADLLALVSAFLVALVIAGPGKASLEQVTPTQETLLFLLSLPGWVLLSKLYGMYDSDERTDHSIVDDLVGVLHVVTVGAWAGVAIGWLSGRATPSPTKAVSFWLAALVLVVAFRLIARTWCRRQPAYIQNTVIVGAGDVGRLVARKLLRHPEYGVRLLGFVDADPKPDGPEQAPVTILGTLEELPTIAQALDVERVIIAFTGERHEEVLRLMRSVKDLDVQVDVVPRLFELVGASVSVHDIEGVPLLGMPPTKLSRSSSIVKRLMDVTLAGLGVVLLLPVALAVAAAIRRESPGPIFFRQQRVGAGGRVFSIFKFRTMYADADARKAEVAHLNKHLAAGSDPRMFKVPDDPRVTRVGRFLRRTSIDELPQLLNVLRGDMSLVGPRPLILDEDRHVTDWARKRLFLRPGMTGIWQVLGRDDIPFEEMIRLDYLYVTNWSLRSDVRLLCRTLPAVLRTGRSDV